MTDIIERLLEPVDYLPREVRQEAADYIKTLQAHLDHRSDVNTQLRSDNERLLDALKTIECHSIDHTDACRMAGKARREPKP